MLRLLRTAVPALALAVFALTAFGQRAADHPRLRAALHELREARAELKSARDTWPAGYRERAMRSINDAIESVRTILAVKSLDDFRGVERGPDFYKRFADHPRLRAALQDLREAREELRAAKADFGGKKARAIDDIDVAIGDILTLVRNRKSLSLFSDSFDRRPARSLGPDWVIRSGGFSVASRMAVSAVPPSIATVKGVPADNSAIQADVEVPLSSSQGAGLVARYQGPGDDNMYVGSIACAPDGPAAYIHKNVGGTWTQLDSKALPTGTGTLRFEVVDNSLKLFFNDRLVAAAVDTDLPSGGAVGIRATGGIGLTFDNFSITAR